MSYKHIQDMLYHYNYIDRIENTFKQNLFIFLYTWYIYTNSKAYVVYFRFTFGPVKHFNNQKPVLKKSVLGRT